LRREIRIPTIEQIMTITTDMQTSRQPPLPNQGLSRLRREIRIPTIEQIMTITTDMQTSRQPPLPNQGLSPVASGNQDSND
jgi:hypothetical protein